MLSAEKAFFLDILHLFAHKNESEDVMILITLVIAIDTIVG